MKSYHFSLGDSSSGPIGFCARVTASDKGEALELLKAFLPEEYKIYIPADFRDDQRPDSTRAGIEYVNVYFNLDAVTLQDIDDENDLDEGEEISDEQ